MKEMSDIIPLVVTIIFAVGGAYLFVRIAIAELKKEYSNFDLFPKNLKEFLVLEKMKGKED